MTEQSDRTASVPHREGQIAPIDKSWKRLNPKTEILGAGRSGSRVISLETQPGEPCSGCRLRRRQNG